MRQQVAEMLLEEAWPHREVRISQSEPATLLGASRQTENEAIGEVQEAGAVETGYRLLRVVDPDRLIGYSGR